MLWLWICILATFLYFNVLPKPIARCRIVAYHYVKKLSRAHAAVLFKVYKKVYDTKNYRSVVLETIRYPSRWGGYEHESLHTSLVLM